MTDSMIISLLVGAALAMVAYCIYVTQELVLNEDFLVVWRDYPDVTWKRDGVVFELYSDKKLIGCSYFAGRAFREARKALKRTVV